MSKMTPPRLTIAVLWNSFKRGQRSRRHALRREGAEAIWRVAAEVLEHRALLSAPTLDWGVSLGTSTGRSTVSSTAVDSSGRVVAPGDAYQQTVTALRRIEAALLELGSSLSEVVRTRIYVTDISQWASIGRAHQELLGSASPAATMVEVSRLIDDELLVEVEVDAITDS